MVTVKFFDSRSQELNTRQFQPLQWVNINCYATGLAGLGEPFTQISCDVFSGSVLLFSQQQTSNLWGIANFQLQFPENVSGQGRVIVTASFTVAGNERKEVPIAFGTSNPAELPEPASDWLTALRNNILIIAVIGVGVWFVVKRKLL